MDPNTVSQMTNKEILAIEFYSVDLLEKITIKAYLIELLKTLWLECEGFSGKRPLGNSGWQDPIMKALVENGLLDTTNYKAGNELMLKLINSL